MGYLFAGAGIFALGVLFGATIAESNLKKIMGYSDDDKPSGPRSI